jgi:signal transduction histidine kinase
MIARELHDVLAHAIAVINVQSGVGLHLMDRQPEQAREALTTIRRASGDALAELRGLLHTLRDGGPPDGRAQPPTVGLAQLDPLLAASQSAGVQVELEVVGDLRPLAPAVDLAAYRIIQESLTNVGKHAQPPHAHVRVHYGPHMIEITVRDEGRKPTQPPSGGRGLAGMRERAAALGGVFAAGHEPSGGFTVRAELPTEDEG